MEPQLPQPDYLLDEEWEWPWNKFSLDPEVLFTTLHTRFNLRTLPIQDPFAFYHDVCECIEDSDTLNEFYSKLEERKAQRMGEIASAWDDVTGTIVAFPRVLGCKQCFDQAHPEREMSPGSENDSTVDRWGAFSRLNRTLSLDSLVRFFDGYTRDKRKVRKEKGQRLAELLEQKRKKKRIEQHSESVAASATVQRAPSRSTHLLSLEPIQTQPSVTTTVHDDLGAQNPSHGISTLETPATSRTHSNQSQFISSSSQAGPQTAESLPLKKRKRADGENNAEEVHTSKRKKQRVIGDGVENNADNLAAGQHESNVTEAVSVATPRRPEKRKAEGGLRTDSLEPVSKRARSEDSLSHLGGYSRDSTPVLTQPPLNSGLTASQLAALNTQPAHTSSEILSNWAGTDISLDHLARSLRDSTPVLTQAPSKSDGDASELAALNNTQAEQSSSKRPKRKPRVSRRRVGKRDVSPSREEQPTPQKQTRRKRGGKGQSQEQKPPAVERLLRSKRSSRRDPVQELFYLGDDATACSVSNTR